MYDEPGGIFLQGDCPCRRYLEAAAASVRRNEDMLARCTPAEAIHQREGVRERGLLKEQTEKDVHGQHMRVGQADPYSIQAYSDRSRVEADFANDARLDHSSLT